MEREIISNSQEDDFIEVIPASVQEEQKFDELGI